MSKYFLPEEKVVLAVCREGLSANGTTVKPFVFPQNLDWHVLIKVLQKEGLLHVFYHEVRNNREIPEMYRSLLKKGYYNNLTKNTLLLSELGRILSIFRSKGIQAVVLKGVALAEAVYADIGLRSMSDGDVLIAPERWSKANAILNEEGYEAIDLICNREEVRVTPYLNTYSYGKEDSPLSLHLHWHLVNSTLPSHSYVFRFDMEKIWKSVLPVKIAGEEVMALAPHHLIIHLAEHAQRLRHSFDRLILLYDIALTIRVYRDILNREALVQESRSFNMDKMVYYALLMTSQYFAVSLDEEEHRLKPEKITIGEKMYLSMVTRNRRQPGLSYAVHFAMNQGMRKKIEFLYRTVSPPENMMGQRGSTKTLFSSLKRVGEIISYFGGFMRGKK